RRDLELAVDLLEAIVEPGVGRRIVRPYHRSGRARTERHGHDIAGRERHGVGHPIRIGLVERDRHQDIDDALCHRLLTWSVIRPPLKKGEGSGCDYAPGVKSGADRALAVPGWQTPRILSASS